MKSLIQIVKIANRKRLKNLDVIDSKILEDKDNLHHKFYKGIDSGQFITDSDASFFFYESDPTDSRYRKLKSRFKNKLFNSVIFFDNENLKVSNYERMYYRCYRDFLSHMFLFRSGGRSAVVKDISRLLIQAEKYEFHDISISICNLLLDHFVISNNTKGYKSILLKKKRFMKLYKLENLSLGYSYSSDFVSKKPKINTNSKIALLKENLERVIDIEKKGLSNIIANCRFNCAIHFFVFKRDYKNLIKSINHYEAYLSKQTLFSTSNKLAKVTFYKTLGYLHLSDFERGTESVLKADTLLKKGTNNWALFKEYHYLLSIKTERYYQAFDVLHTVNSHPRFNTNLSSQKERWRIFEAYLEWVIANNKGLKERIATFRVDKGQKPDKTFRLAKFLNDVPTYEKDKRGLNVAIIIIGILWNLKRENFNPIIDKQDSLKTYTQRYLKEDDSYRSKMFLYMLITMIKKSFNYEKTKRLSKKYFDKLKTKDMHYQGGSIDLEIVPYEKLWPMVLKLLKEQGGK